MFRITQCYVGINIGSVSVNFVNIVDKNINIIKRPHLGKPSEVLDEILEENKSLKDCFYRVSGSFGDVSEVVAVERGVSSFEEKFHFRHILNLSLKVAFENKFSKNFPPDTRIPCH